MAFSNGPERFQELTRHLRDMFDVRVPPADAGPPSAAFAAEFGRFSERHPEYGLDGWAGILERSGLGPRAGAVRRREKMRFRHKRIVHPGRVMV